MALFGYRQQVQRLLADLSVARFAPGDLDSYINTARGQIAGEGECVRVYASLTVNGAAQQYQFSSITLPAGTTGVAGVLNVRMVTYQIPGTAGQVRMTSREWEWFNTFVLSNPVPVAGPPTFWCQFGQGALGTIFVNLLDQQYTLALDTVCYPSALRLDSDPEKIPYLFTDAVPYFAAYLALLQAQQADAAAGMFKLYSMFMNRARGAATPSVLPGQYEQAPDPEMANRLGLQMKAAG